MIGFYRADPELRRLETRNFCGVEYDIFAHVHGHSNVIGTVQVVRTFLKVFRVFLLPYH